MNRVVVCENIRSSYNIGNIIRTADALGYDIILSGYSVLDEKVLKTSLGAEKRVKISQIWNTKTAVLEAKKYGEIFCAEILPTSISLEKIENKFSGFVLGNEVEGVLSQTLSMLSTCVYIPMNGVKESLNVGQAGAIIMWHMNFIS